MMVVTAPTGLIGHQVLTNVPDHGKATIQPDGRSEWKFDGVDSGSNNTQKSP
jgi:hypothetical protein